MSEYNKTIHYIWLGGKKKPLVIRRCIASWKKYMPDWEIKEWNESNIDVALSDFCKEAYDAKKYAFAADYLRFYVLNEEGGLYFDTDVKLLKSLEHITDECEGFTGYEYEMTSPGLVLYAKHPKMQVINEMVEMYNHNHFICEGVENHTVVGDYFSRILEKYGFVYEDKYQKCGDFTVFPSTYFCPTDGYGNKINFTEDSHSIHLFASSWMPMNKRIVKSFKKVMYRIFGLERIQRFLNHFR